MNKNKNFFKNRMKAWLSIFLAMFFINFGVSTYAFEVDLQNDTIYQIMVDRFFDGDPSNNGTGNTFKHEMDEEIDMHFMKGGDWQGVIDKMDYIQEMGFTAIWISPIADPQLWRLPAPDGSQFPAAYHAYNAHDPNRANRYFGNIDPELSRQKLKELVDVAHAAGIKVIIDVVPNHVGDFLQNGNYISPGGVEPGTQFQPAAPFNNRDWYHHNGDTDFNRDFGSLTEKRDHFENTDLGSLDDIEYDNPDAKNGMFGAIKDWYTYLEADGARVDAAKSMFPWDINELEQLLDVPTFGENFDGSVDFVSMWIGEGAEWGMLDFPMYFAIRSGLSRGESFENAGGIADILSQDHKYNGNANRLVTFVDNHDRNRLLAETLGNTDKSKNAIAFLYTVRGVPVVFQGTEAEKGNVRGQFIVGGIEDSWNRWPMVEKDANGNVVEDAFLLQTATKNLLTQLNDARKTYVALRTGTQREMWKQPDVYAFSRRVDEGIGEGQEVIAAFTNSNDPQTRTIPLRAESSIPTGATLVNVLNPNETITVSAARTLNISMPAQGHKIYVYAPDLSAPTVPANLSVESVTGSSVSLSWNAANDENGIGLYEIFRNGVHVNTSTTLSVTDTDLKSETSYSYQVRAVDNSGNASDLGTAVIALTGELTVETTTIYYKRGFDTPHIHYRQANGVWTTAPGIALSDAPGFPGYSITSAIELSVSNELEAVFNDGGSNWDNNNDQNYFFGPGVFTFDGGVITAGQPAGADTTPPTIPQDLAVTATTATTVSLSWTASTDASGIARYEIIRDGSQVGTSTTTSFSDSGLTPLTQFEYQVRAVDVAENSSTLSSAVTAETQEGSATVSMTFSINGAPTLPGDNVFIVGDIPELGAWVPADARGPGDGSGFPVWVVVVDNLPADTAIQYKAIIIKADGSVVWEPDAQNHFSTTPISGSGESSFDW